MRYFFFMATLAFVRVSAINHNASISEIFTEIYETNEWDRDSNGLRVEVGGKKISGSGSSVENARIYMEFLKDFFKKKNIKSVVDVGCGDWEFSQHIDWNGINYTGVDVVDHLIKENTKKFSAKNITFIKSDGIEYNLPKADVLICKDVLQHLTFKDILSIITQLKKFKYCILVNDVDTESLTCENVDMPRGYYRTIDLTKAPFFLKGRKVLTYASGVETKQVLLIENKYYN